MGVAKMSSKPGPPPLRHRPLRSLRKRYHWIFCDFRQARRSPTLLMCLAPLRASERATLPTTLSSQLTHQASPKACASQGVCLPRQKFRLPLPSFSSVVTPRTHGTCMHSTTRETTHSGSCCFSSGSTHTFAPHPPLLFAPRGCLRLRWIWNWHSRDDASKPCAWTK